MKVGYLTMEAHDQRKLDSVGSSRIRGRWVMKYSDEIVPFINGEHHDAMIYQKAYWKEHMEQFKGPKIFDICDPDWMDGRPVVELASIVDAFTVPTEPLAQALRAMVTVPVVVIPDRIDPDWYPDRKTHHEGRLRTLVWYGYSTNQIVLEPVANFLKEAGYTLVVISDRPYHLADVNIMYRANTVNSEIIKYDACLLPTETENIRFKFKSNNKTLGAWALGMPVVTGPDDLEKFESGESRQAESDLRYGEILTKWHVKESVKQYMDLIAQIQEGKK